MTRTETLQMLEATLQKTEDWMRSFIEHTGRDDEQKAWAMMRAVLHVLRDRLPIEQCAHLSAQLPLVIRGLYFENFKPAEQPIKLRSQDEFIQAVGQILSEHPEIDPRQAIDGTLHVLNEHVSQGELTKIRNMLQPEILALWPEN